MEYVGPAVGGSENGTPCGERSGDRIQYLNALNLLGPTRNGLGEREATGISFS